MATAASGSDERSARRGERLRDHAREMQASFTGLQTSAREVVQELAAAAREQLEVHPYTMLGTCFAVGWILGGGLTPRMLRRLGTFGGRMALSMTVQRIMAERDGPAPPGSERAGAS